MPYSSCADKRKVFVPRMVRIAVNWKRASFFHREADALRCTLCAHACLLEEGATGQCWVRRRAGSVLETATFATTVRHFTPLERKPLYHFQPGRPALTLGAPGCSFRCAFCENHRLSQWGRSAEAESSAQPVEPERIVADAVAAGAVIALSYSEPILAAELTVALAQAGRQQGVEVVWKTNGFITPSALETLAPHLAAVNVDLKAVTEETHRRLVGAPLAPVLEAIRGFIRAGVWVEISALLIPGVNTDEASLLHLAETVADLGGDIPLHLVRFLPDYEMRSTPPTPPRLLLQARELAQEAGLKFVYVERALGEAGRTTCCPICKEVVVTRDLWQTREVRLIEDRCPQCGSLIPGRWHSEKETPCPPTHSFATSLI